MLAVRGLWPLQPHHPRLVVHVRRLGSETRRRNTSKPRASQRSRYTACCPRIKMHYEDMLLDLGSEYIRSHLLHACPGMLFGKAHIARASRGRAAHPCLHLSTI